MNCNVGGFDMIARIVAGAILLVVAFFVPMETVWQTVIIVLGTIALVTGLIRYCPANALLGLNTCKQEPRRTAGGK
jgi:hypothetical protein